MRRLILKYLCVSILCVLGVTPALTPSSQAQELHHSNSIRVYVDCFLCDRSHIKSELTYLTFVRERQQADVHLLITRQGTGAGGTEYTVTFLGQNRFSAIHDTLRFISRQTQTRDATRGQLVDIIRMGMVQYLARTPMRDNLDISYATQAAVEKQPEEEQRDPWNHWIFNINLNTSASGQQTTQSTSLSGSVNTHRVTRQWKMMLLGATDYSEDLFQLNGGEYTSITRNRQSRISVVRSLGNHFSAGIWGSVRASTFENLAREIAVEPRVEYNLFPYTQSTRRQFRMIYGIGPKWRRYLEETIYYKTEQQLWQESITLVLDVVQPWGSSRASITGSHYFHNFSRNRLQVSGNLSINIVEGFSLDVSGSYSSIHDQLSLPRAGATPEEILLRRKQLETQYNYEFKVGFSYTFGSIYDSIVNPRFGGWWFI